MRNNQLRVRISDNVKTTREQLVAVAASIDRLKLSEESGCVETWQPADQGDNRALRRQMAHKQTHKLGLMLGN